MIVKKTAFGALSTGEIVTKFVLENDSGLSIGAIDYGATLTSVIAPDREGNADEVTLGFDSIAGYEGDHPYFGATIGRYANRITNGGFTLAGKRYDLNVDDLGIHLHGGLSGFNRKMWSAEIEAEGIQGAIRFNRTSPNGEEHYPGNLDVTISFILTEGNELTFDYAASTDQPTPVNLTNHTYWNLAGPGGPVYDHLLTLYADKYLETDDTLLPTGGLVDVDATPMDFREEKQIDKGVPQTEGYDHCFTLIESTDEMKPAARVKDPSSGRCMSIETTQPAIQFYTATQIEEIQGRRGEVYKKHGAYCLETGSYTNAVNTPSFPDSVLQPGETYRHTTRHTFQSE